MGAVRKRQASDVRASVVPDSSAFNLTERAARTPRVLALLLLLLGCPRMLATAVIIKLPWRALPTRRRLTKKPGGRLSTPPGNDVSRP
jgi:hypothetical protein